MESPPCCRFGLSLTCQECKTVLTRWSDIPIKEATLFCKCKTPQVGFLCFDFENASQPETGNQSNTAWDSTLVAEHPELVTIRLLRECKEDEDHALNVTLTWEEWEAWRNEMRRTDLQNDQGKRERTFTLTEEQCEQEKQSAMHAALLRRLDADTKNDSIVDDDEDGDDINDPETPFWEFERERAPAAVVSDGEDEDEDEDEDGDENESNTSQMPGCSTSQMPGCSTTTNCS